MALVLADRVLETTNTTGTGTLTLNGALPGYQSFSAIGNGNTTYYTIFSGVDWETGVGTYTSSGTTLSRDTVYASSAGGSKISVAAGASVFCDYPSGRAVYRDAANAVTLPGALNLAAGTTTVPPLDFASGTNLTTALAGAVEYDGKVPYFTPQGTQRGVTPAEQFYRLNSAVAGANATGAQSVFGVGVTLSSSTVYRYQGFFALSKTAGTTSHTISYGFGGTATNNNFLGAVRRYGLSQALPFTGTAAATIVWQVNTAPTVTVATGALTSASFTDVVEVWGTISVNAGGTFIPQYSLSAAPGGAYSTQIGSWFSIYPIGASGANTSVGTWA